MSTGPPALARRLADELGAAGIASLDAPVSGGPRGAEAATLSIFVGGDAETFARVEPVHEGARVCRRPRRWSGAGQVVKLCNNLMAGVNMAAVARPARSRDPVGPRPAALLRARHALDRRLARAPHALSIGRRGRDASGQPGLRGHVHGRPDRQGPRPRRDLAAEHGLDADVARTALAAYQRRRTKGSADATTRPSTCPNPPTGSQSQCQSKCQSLAQRTQALKRPSRKRPMSWRWPSRTRSAAISPRTSRT